MTLTTMLWLWLTARALTRLKSAPATPVPGDRYQPLHAWVARHGDGSEWNYLLGNNGRSWWAR